MEKLSCVHDDIAGEHANARGFVELDSCNSGFSRDQSAHASDLPSF